MSKKTTYIFLIFFLFCVSLSAQTKKPFSQTPADKLAEAKRIQTNSPKQAIRLLEDIISEKGKQGNTYKAPAYMLMGVIYEEIEEEELAAERYRQAQLFITPKEADLYAENRFRLGKLDLKANNLDKAKRNFQLCIDHAPQSKWITQCQEGLADVAFAQQDFDKSIQQIEIIQNSQTPLDSSSVARLEAKKSINFLQQSNISDAQVASCKAIENTPNVSDLENFGYINDMSQSLINAFPDSTIKIKTTEGLLAQKIEQQLQPEVIIPDQLLLADLYSEQFNIDASERLVNDAKTQLLNTKNPQLEAMVYQKSAEVNFKKKDYKKAYLELQLSLLAHEKKDLVEQSKVAKKVDIFKGQRNIDLLEKDIAIEAQEQQFLHTQLRNQKIVNGLLATLLLASIVSFFYIMRNVRAKRRVNQRLMLKSLRTQMNPHFLFNALNSVNGFIIKNDERAANKFLSNFSKLMRKVLDNSQEDFISLEEEINLLDLYLQLEHSRFRDKFDYVVEKNVDTSTLSLDIPPMLIQPFIENAVWHGLRYKKEKGKLRFSISETEKELLIQVEDNGIGRAQSKALKTNNQKKYKSTGLRNIGERIEVINDLYAKNYQIEVQDVHTDANETGTLVNIKIPKQ